MRTGAVAFLLFKICQIDPHGYCNEEHLLRLIGARWKGRFEVVGPTTQLFTSTKNLLDLTHLVVVHIVCTTTTPRSGQSEIDTSWCVANNTL